MSDYYKIERALLSYVPHKLTDKMQEDLELSISHYDEFNKCPISSKETELYNFTSMLLFQEEQKIVNDVNDYFIEKYNKNIYSMLFNIMLEERFE